MQTLSPKGLIIFGERRGSFANTSSSDVRNRAKLFFSCSSWSWSWLSAHSRSFVGIHRMNLQYFGSICYALLNSRTTLVELPTSCRTRMRKRRVLQLVVGLVTVVVLARHADGRTVPPSLESRVAHVASPGDVRFLDRVLHFPFPVGLAATPLVSQASERGWRISRVPTNSFFAPATTRRRLGCLWKKARMSVS